MSQKNKKVVIICLMSKLIGTKKSLNKEEKGKNLIDESSLDNTYINIFKQTLIVQITFKSMKHFRDLTCTYSNH